MVGPKPVAQLVHGDIVEDVARSQHQPPVEGEPPVGGARAPSRPLVADRERPVGDAEPRRLAGDRAEDRRACLLAVPAPERPRSRKRPRHAADPDGVVSLEAQQERLRELRQLALEPAGVLVEKRADGTGPRPRWHDDLDLPPRVDDDP
jgi:hypothetical protein